MASSADAANAPSPPLGPQATPRGWKRWLLLGVCFGLGYGVTQRLLSLRVETDWQGRQRFEVKSFPGTELESLRRRFGEASMEIRGDLDLLELERQRKREAAAIEQRRNAMEERERLQQDSSTPTEAVVTPPAAVEAPLPDAPTLPPEPEPEPFAPVPPPAPPAGDTPSTP